MKINTLRDLVEEHKWQRVISFVALSMKTVVKGTIVDFQVDRNPELEKGDVDPFQEITEENCTLIIHQFLKRLRQVANDRRSHSKKVQSILVGKNNILR